MYNKKSPAEHRNTFWVLSKSPVISYYPNSSISPYYPDFSKLRVKLRFDPMRKYHHPDDNDVIFDCSSTLFDRLQEGMYGIGTWKKKELLDFTPIEKTTTMFGADE